MERCLVVAGGRDVSNSFMVAGFPSIQKAEGKYVCFSACGMYKYLFQQKREGRGAAVEFSSPG